MVAGSKRRKVEDTKPFDLENLALKIEGIESQRDRCLIALLYLSGRRINEILHLQKKDFRVEENRISFETFNEKVYRKKPTGNYQIEHHVGMTDHNLIGFYEKIRPHWRTDKSTGKLLSVFVVERLGSLDQEDYLFQKLRGVGSIGYVQAYNTVRFYFPLTWPHLFRHNRFTEVAKVYKDDPVAMHRFTFHKRFESTLGYIRNLEEEKI